jgi:hypothetical protein
MWSRFGCIFPDSYKYMAMLDNWLGRGTGADVPAPFAYRILLPFLSIPLGLFMPSEFALSIMSGIGAIMLVVVMFYICREFTEHDVVAMIVVLGAITSAVFKVYGAVPLTDAPAMLFLALIVLGTLRQWSGTRICLLVCVGVLLKELVIFGAIFYLLYKRSASAAQVLLNGTIILFLIRVMVAGTLYQPLAFHPPPVWVIDATMMTLSVLCWMSCLVVVAWVRHDTGLRESMKLLMIGLLSFMPYYLLGVFNAYFGPRFAWPLHLAFLGVATVGVNSAYESIVGRIEEIER